MGNLQIEDYPICPWYTDYEPLSRDEEKIYNIIVVEGKSEEKMVMAYFEGYGCLKTFMIIDRDYNGESFCDGYYQDLMENIYDFFDPISKIPLIRNEAKDLFNNCDGNEFYEKIIKDTRHAGDKARIYPFKVTLRNLKEQISSMENTRTINNLNYNLDNLTKVFQKYGIDAFIRKQLEMVTEIYQEDILLEKIFIHLSYLMEYFKKAGVKFKIIEEIVKKI